MKLTVIITLLLIGQLTNAQDRIQKVDSLLNDMYANKSINGNFLIAEKGNVIYNKSFGLANEISKEKLNENSIFELCSVGKQFTAMGIMILKEKGKLNLDDDFTKHLPELYHYKGITIKNLLNHTGGLPDYIDLIDSLFDKSKIATNKDIITLFAKHRPKVLFEPNTEYQYSNTGYAILGSIIEKVSGKTYADFLATTIFKPLKMKSTFVYTRRLQPKKIKNYAYGYVYSDSLKKYVLPDDFEKYKYVVWLDGIVGDGAVNSTVNDLLKWDSALYTNKLLSESDGKQLFEAATLNDNTKTKYGLGWFVEDNADFGKIVNHSGSWPGYRTYIDRHTDNNMTIIILQNHEEITVPIKPIRHFLYNKPFRAQKIKLTNDQLQKFVGIYEISKGFEMNIYLEKDQLFSQLTGRSAYPIFAENETQFFLKMVEYQIHFEKNAAGEIPNLFIILQDGRKLTAERIR